MSGKDNSYKSALRVNKGIEQPPDINPEMGSKLVKSSQSQHEVDYYFSGIIQGNRTILAKAITLVESTLPEHQEIAQEIIGKCLPHSGNSIRVGITGVPGVGKSTFIETLGTYLTSRGNKLAVLAIDPSSQKSKGSILGDKTRMEMLSVNQNAFIRPSPSAGTLGGVARKTRETALLCEAAGYNIIIIETVGVGQSETAVHDMVDFFLLLMLAGAGDELQGIKRGIMEMADGIAINKAEAENLQKALLAKSQLENALHYLPAPESGWKTMVNTCSALANTGIDEVWEMIENFIKFCKTNSYFERRRQQQDKKTMMNFIEDSLMQHFRKNPKIKSLMKELEESVAQRRYSAYVAAQKLTEFYFSNLHSKE